METKLTILKSIAKNYSKPKGRKRLLTDEQLDLVRKMRSSGFSHQAIFNAMSQEKMMPYSSFNSFYQAYRNR